MNRPALSLLCGLVYLLTGPGAASAGQIAADTGCCQVSSMPLDPSNALVGLRLSRTSFLGISREYSTASLELINLSSVSLEGVAVIVEYLDASDKVVLRIPFYATSTDENLTHPPFPYHPPSSWTKLSDPMNASCSSEIVHRSLRFVRRKDVSFSSVVGYLTGQRRTSLPPWIQTCSQMCFRLILIQQDVGYRRSLTCSFGSKSKPPAKAVV